MQTNFLGQNKFIAREGGKIFMVQGMQQQAHPAGVGTSLPRQDGPDKVTGRARYAGDQVLPGMLFARLVISPYAHARILHIDTSAALSIPGVLAVFTAETLPMAQADSLSRAQCPLARQEVLWCGHPVALVVGETESLAEDGASAVEVDYDPLPIVIDPEAAARPDSPPARSSHEDSASSVRGEQTGIPQVVVSAKNEERSPNVSQTQPLIAGDIEAGLREAEVVVECTYRTHPVHQSYMEPQSVIVAPSPSGHRLVLWPSTQGLLSVRSAVARALQTPERQIQVESVPIGGGFGGKETLLEPLVAAVASQLRKPVRLVYTRQEDLLAGNPAPQMVMTVKLGARRDGTLTALQARVLLDSGAFPNPLAGLSGFHFSGIYRCPNLDIRCEVVQTNKPGTGAYRAPAGPQAFFALESTVQELCQQLAIDPLRFRQINALKEGDPNVLFGHWPRIGMLECLEQIQQHPLWVHREQAKQEVPPELKGWKIGIGVAAGGWPGGTEPAAALCRLEQDGSFTVVVGSVDLSGSDASLALIAAEGLNLPAEAVYVTHDNTDSMPYSGLTAGSKTTYTVGAAVLSAARDARNQVFTIAADMLEAAIEDMEMRDGKIMVKGVPEKHVTLQQIAANTMRFGAPYEPILGRGRSANRVASPVFTVHLAKVAVDPETGTVRVLDYVAAQDVGCAINPAEVEGQVHGGVVQGIGWALLEQMAYDENGQLLTATLMEYALPHSQDVPPITPLLVEIPSALGPFGAKGVGEPPVVPVAAAIANAIRDAVGVRMTQIPMTPERVFASLSESAISGESAMDAS
jgi:CO/xanthine dehydrogenase Mo-binding subunit